jgi:triacylglycerol lipase
MSTRREPWWGRPLAESRWARDGRPVLLLPGFLAGDQTLLLLGSWLRRIGHRPYGCGFVANAGCSDRALERVERRVEQLHRRHGRRVAVVGHSRGGHYARALAHRRPDRVSHAVALGADLQRMFGISAPTLAAVTVTRRVVSTLRRGRSPECLTADCACSFARDFAAPLPADRVRFTSVYSKGDGVVRWPGSVIADADCVEVTGSHVGLICNRKAYRAIAEALAEPELT